MHEDSDEALMARVARGDEPAFRELARRHMSAMLALAAHIIGPADADDVAQEAFLRVWTNAPRWQPLAMFRTWITRIVVNLCLDRRRRATMLPLEAAGDPAGSAPDAARQIEIDETEREMTAAIAALPDRQRAVIVLTYREGLSNAETAAALDTSVGAVETLLVRAKQALRKSLRAGKEPGERQ